MRSTTRHTLAGAIVLIAGLAIAAGLTWSVSRIAAERIGLDAAPPSVASGLAPRPEQDRRATHGRARIDRQTMPDATPRATPSPTPLPPAISETTPTPAPTMPLTAPTMPLTFPARATSPSQEDPHHVTAQTNHDTQPPRSGHGRDD